MGGCYRSPIPFREDGVPLKITVIGCGYVGLVTGGCLAAVGHHVTCVDNDPKKISALEAGHIPIYELHLEEVIAACRKDGRIKFSGDLPSAIQEGEAIFICVGTPPLENGEADLSAIDAVARIIAAEAKGPKLVVEKSTVPVQTGQQLKRALEVYGRKSGAHFRVVSNPEFLREGTAVLDFMHPDRIVVGVEDEAAAKQMREIYAPILDRKFKCPVHPQGCPPGEKPHYLVTTINSSELIKHACNSFLALKISYANVLADLCERLGGNIEEVTRAMGMDPRIGPFFLKAGIGFGGFCLPKDLQAFVALARRAGVDFSLLREAENVNKDRIEQFLAKIRRALWVLKGKQVGLLGLTFKANTDDIRFAPSIDLIRKLLAEGASLRAYDPEAMERTRETFPQVRYADPYEVADKADALLIVTEWEEFKKLDWARVRDSMMRPLVFDGRNLLDPAKMRELGFEYQSIGRP